MDMSLVSFHMCGISRFDESLTTAWNIIIPGLCLGVYPF